MMRRLLGAIFLAMAIPQAAIAAVIFSEDFSGIAAGWTFGPTWEIGPATASVGQSIGDPDPARDHTPTNDNRLAGAVIGGNVPPTLHDFYYLVSPVIDTSGITGTLSFEFYRWLNSDFSPYMQNRVDVFDGSTWVNLFLTGGAPAVLDSAWTYQLFDITSYANSNLQVRFGYDLTSSGAYIVSGWNVDDVAIYSEEASVPIPSTLVLLGLGIAGIGYRRRRLSGVDVPATPTKGWLGVEGGQAAPSA